jgi:hypothetical protein
MTIWRPEEVHGKARRRETRSSHAMPTTPDVGYAVASGRIPGYAGSSPRPALSMIEGSYGSGETGEEKRRLTGRLI